MNLSIINIISFFQKSLFIYLFIYFDRKIVLASAGEGGERGRQRIPCRLCAASAEPDVGLNPMIREIMTLAKIKSRRLN